MPLTISDDVLDELKMDEREARIEFACRLFDAGKLDLWPAAKLASLSRSEFEGELRQRNIPAYRPSAEDLAQDLNTIDYLKRSAR